MSIGSTRHSIPASVRRYVEIAAFVRPSTNPALSPEAWAGYRFVGVSERRPFDPLTESVELTREQRREFETITAEGATPA